jgi:hypothetical protein
VCDHTEYIFRGNVNIDYLSDNYRKQQLPYCVHKTYCTRGISSHVFKRTTVQPLITFYIDNSRLLEWKILPFTRGLKTHVSKSFWRFPTPMKHRISYQNESKSEHLPGYQLNFRCRYPFDYYIRCSKCWPLNAIHRLECCIMDFLTRST